ARPAATRRADRAAAARTRPDAPTERAGSARSRTRVDRAWAQPPSPFFGSASLAGAESFFGGGLGSVSLAGVAGAAAAAARLSAGIGRPLPSCAFAAPAVTTTVLPA